jgi:glutamate/tyrosine decarboxylase-like PLP-dependent enzyme
VRDLQALRNAMITSASYLPEHQANDRVPSFLVPELSRRARGLPTWAVLKSLGRSGIVRMVRNHCTLARQIARDMDATPGIQVMNDVVLNQIILRFGLDDDGPERRRALAEAVIDQLVREGIIFVGGAAWRGEWVMRISLICDATTVQDAEVATHAIRAAWTNVSAARSLHQTKKR